MARIRSIKPSFFTNDELAPLDPIVRLLFVGLWTLADRDGRLEDRPLRIKAEIMPFDNVDVSQAISSLESVGMLTRYEVDGRKFIEINNFRKHQKPHPQEKPSDIPACREITRCDRETTIPGREINMPSKVVSLYPCIPVSLLDGHTEADAPRCDVRVSFGDFWKLFPRKTNRVQAEQAWAELSPSPELAAEILNRLSEKLSHPDYQAEGGRYVPNAAKWLRERRWLDELPKATGPPAPRPTGRSTAEKMAAYFPAVEGT